MRVRVYVDGDASNAKEYDGVQPHDAARRFVNDIGIRSPARLIAEPVDEEAIALPLWKIDHKGLFRVYRTMSAQSWRLVVAAASAREPKDR